MTYEHTPARTASDVTEHLYALVRQIQTTGPGFEQPSDTTAVLAHLASLVHMLPVVLAGVALPVTLAAAEGALVHQDGVRHAEDAASRLDRVISNAREAATLLAHVLDEATREATRMGRVTK